MDTFGVGSYVLTQGGRVGLWTSTKDGVALVMSGDEKILVRAETLRPAFESIGAKSRGKEVY